MTDRNMTPPPRDPADREAALGAFECRALVELVTEYLDGVLASDEQSRLELHLSACEGCQVYLEQFRLTIAATGRLEPEDVSDEALASLGHLFRRLRPPGSP